MEIILDNIGKKFNNKWIFKDVSTTFYPASAVGITGPNGSGKSTLLHIISGKISPSHGSLKYSVNKRNLDFDVLYRHISMASPYIELIEEYDLHELYSFHSSVKPLLPGIDEKSFNEMLAFKDANNKPLKYFSSGMKQKVKLALAFTSASDLILLDEPCSNLDDEGVEWYQHLFQKYASSRLVLVCSNNHKEELSNCTSFLNVNDYK